MAKTSGKKSAASSRAKAPAKKPSGKSVKKKVTAAVREDAERAVKKSSGALGAAMPWIVLAIALVLAFCFVLGFFMGEDGAGIVGTAVQWFFCGLFGAPAFAFPVLLGYIAIRVLMLRFRWKKEEREPDSEAYEAFVRERNRMLLQVIMSCLCMLIICTMLGVLGDYRDIAIDTMWSDSADDLQGGGVIGSTLGALMNMGFQQLISMLILSLLLIPVVIFMLPAARIAEAIRHAVEEARERRAYLAEQEALEDDEEEIEEEDEEDKKHKNRLAAAAVRAEEQKARGGMTTEELLDDTVRVDTETGEVIEDDAAAEDEPKIGPSEEMLAAQAAQAEAAQTSEDESHTLYRADDPKQDFGGDEGYNEGEFSSMEEAIRKASKGTMPASTPMPEISEMEKDEVQSDAAAVMPDEGEVEEEEDEPLLPYVYPPIDLLEKNREATEVDYTAELQENAKRLVETLKSFKVGVQEITYSRGPTITRYELRPSAGVKVRSIANLVDDIALSLATSGVRIEAPIPNKPAVGIEVPNRERATVYLRDLIDNPKFKEAKSRLTSCLGMDVGGNPIYFDIAKMPHLLIAGATGMGKSVCINSVIVSLLYKAKPEEVKLILIDPKKVEFSIYRDIPHLYAPIVSDPKKAAGALASAVAEMERRFELIEEVGVRDITTYNAVTANDPAKEHMTHMVIIIDELADLMMTAPDAVEESICRLAQKARAAGIHIIIGTQRPSVDVITGLIKANIPSRIACTVASQVDSRTIIDIAGAEKLIGRGDMLFAPVGAAKPMRVQGSFVSESEVEKVVTFVKENNSKAKYNSDFINRIEEEAAKCALGKKGAAAASVSDAGGDDEIEGGDVKFREAVKLAIEQDKISTSLMQRRLGVGYGRAAKIIDTMEAMGYVSKQDGNKPRRVLITMEEYTRRVAEGNLGSTEEE